MPAPDLSFLDALDPSTPDSVTEDGLRVWTVHCRLQFRGMPAPTIPGDGGFDVVDVATLDVATRNLYNEDVEPEVQAEDSPDAVDAQPARGALVKGWSSSTSVDFYGTEMSQRALKMMAAQMGSGDGIPYLPRHNNGLSGPIEWDGAIGRTVHAEVVPTEAVKNAHDATEAQFLLGTTIRLVPIPDVPFSELDDSEQDASKLLKRTGRGEPIGQSIGGWFTSLQVMTDDEDNVVRIIVLGVDLDHLAVTRAPANPDATGISQLRSRVQERMSTRSHEPEPLLEPKYIQAIADGMTDFSPDGQIRTDIGTVTETEHTHMVWYSKPGGPKLHPENIESDQGFNGPRIVIESRHVISAAESDKTVIYQYLKAGVEPGDVPDDELVGGRIGEADEGRAAHDEDDDTEEEDKREPGPDETSQEYATEQTIEPMCAKAEVDRNRVSLSWDKDPTPEAVRTAVQAIRGGDLGPEVQTAFEEAVRAVDKPAPTPVALDTQATAEQSTSEASDARGSAPPVKPPSGTPTTTLPPDQLSEDSTETDMPSLDELTELFAAQLAPLTAKLADLEARGAGGAPVLTVDEQLAAEQARNLRLEMQLDRALEAPARQGHARSGRAIPGTLEAEEGLSLDISQAKQGGQCRATAVAAERMMPLLSVKRPVEGGVLREVGDVTDDIKANYKSFLRAATVDGLFREGVNPFVRALDSADAGSVLVQNVTNKTVQQLHDRELGVSTTLPRVPGQGTHATIPNRTPGSGGEWVIDTDTYTGNSKGTYAAPEFPYKTHGLEGRVTRFLQATGRSYGDVLGNSVIGRTGDWSETYENGVLLGDIAVDPKQFDGLFTLIGAVGTQVIAQTSGVAGDSLTLGKIDKTIDQIKGGANGADLIIYANKYGRRKLAAQLQAQQSFGDNTVIGAGFRVRTYDGSPIVIAEQIPKTMIWSGTAITAYVGGATTAIVIVNKRYVWIEVLTPLTVAPNASGTSQFSSFDIFSDSVLVLANGLGAAILGGIKVDDN